MVQKSFGLLFKDDIMLVTRNCKCCNVQFKARQADVNRGWALFCNKSCKAKYQVSNKRVKPLKKLVTVSYNTVALEEFNRFDLQKKLLNHLIYEWDNNIFEQSLQQNNLVDAYRFVVDHSKI